MTIDGTYDITIQTAQGPQPMTIDLQTSGAELQGQARHGEESLDLLEPSYAGNNVTFKLSVTKPMPLTLTLDADVDGDLITGTASVAGMKLAFDGKRV